MSYSGPDEAGCASPPSPEPSEGRARPPRAELVLASRRGEGGAPDVVVEVEVSVVDPYRRTNVKRRVAHLLPVTRDQVELGFDGTAQLVSRRRGSLEDPHRPDVHVADLIL